MVASLDGFVARKDNDVSWMEASWCSYEKGAEFSADVLKTIDCYVMGSHTYELALKLGWPYGDTRTIVVTRRELPRGRETVEFHSGDLNALVNGLGGKNVWLVGGPTLYQEFFRLRLVDQVCLTVVPILLGSGIAFFRGNEQKLQLKETTAFKNGMIDAWYAVVPP
jgi:dihydrofolate reductase